MSTRSLICIDRGSDRIESIYCHYDGGLDWVGRILPQHYSEPEQVEELFLLGDLSGLGPEIGVSRPATTTSTSEQCIAYHRDMGQLKRDRVFCSLAELPAVAEESWAKYVYLFKDGAWTLLLGGLK